MRIRPAPSHPLAQPSLSPSEADAGLSRRYFAGEITKRARGVVVLAGWSFGGLVAYEIARQLSAAPSGPRVGSLVLIDWVERGMALAGGHDPQLGAVVRPCLASPAPNVSA